MVTSCARSDSNEPIQKRGGWPLVLSSSSRDSRDVWPLGPSRDPQPSQRWYQTGHGRHWESTKMVRRQRDPDEDELPAGGGKMKQTRTAGGRERNGKRGPFKSIFSQLSSARAGRFWGSERPRAEEVRVFGCFRLHLGALRLLTLRSHLTVTEPSLLPLRAGLWRPTHPQTVVQLPTSTGVTAEAPHTHTAALNLAL